MLMRGAVPGRGRRQFAAKTRRCSTSLSPRPPSTPSFTSSLIYAAERGRKKSSTDRRTDTATPLVGLSSFRPLVFAWLSLHSRLSIPFQRLGMLRRVDGLAEEQCGDSLPPSKKTWSRESPQSIYRVGSYQSFHIIPRVSVEGWFP